MKQGIDLLDHPVFGIALFLLRLAAAVVCAWMVFRYIEVLLSAWVRERLLGADALGEDGGFRIRRSLRAIHPRAGCI